MGGTAIKPGDFNIVRFPGSWSSASAPDRAPPTGGTDGSVEYVGFVVPDVQEAVAKWKPRCWCSGNNNRLDQAWVTPDGLRIEVLQDKSRRCDPPRARAFLRRGIRDPANAGLVRQALRRQAGVRNEAPVADILHGCASTERHRP
jgi:hypothetical protein